MVQSHCPDSVLCTQKKDGAGVMLRCFPVEQCPVTVLESEIDCNACRYLETTEEEQNIYKAQGVVRNHYCQVNHIRLFHWGYHPKLIPCKECRGKGFRPRNTPLKMSCEGRYFGDRTCELCFIVSPEIHQKCRGDIFK